MSYGLAVLGVTVHCVLLLSIFDIYYSSPLIHRLPPHAVKSTEPPAKRVVVFSADGLRLRSFTDHPEKSPYLHGLIGNRMAISAISHSHVPTESRPGHVALFAGFTEDVSAVAHGWQKNPVSFDSVFNRSRESWLFGSPDITGLFDDLSHVHHFSYSQSHEDFGSASAHKMDEWVFTKVEDLLKSAEEGSELCARLRSDRVILFLHLLGIDTNGHGYNPESNEYLDNIKVVDEGIRKVQVLLDGYFNDGRTAYIFTSDHGMTDWGSHGAGSDDEVLVPFVAWGAGIKNGGPRKIIAQVDTAPLISSLLGIPIPINSLGVLPVHLLNVSPKYEYLSVLANFHQLREQLLYLRSKKSNRLFFTEYEIFGSKSLSALEEELNKLAKLGRYSAAASLFSDNSATIKQAIFYYHRYDRTFLGAAVSASFLAWILLLYCHLVNPDKKLHFSSLLLPNAGFCSLLVLALLMCIYYGYTFSCTLYVLLPVYLFSLVENMSNFTSQLVHYLSGLHVTYSSLSVFSSLARPYILLNFTAVFLGIFIMAFLDRRWLSLIFILLLLLPSFYESSLVHELSLYWRLACLSLLPFPFLPPVGSYESPLLCVSVPLLSSLFLWIISYRCQFLRANSGLLRKISIAHFFCGTFIFLQIVFFKKPPLVFRLICWLTIPTAFVLPLFAEKKLLSRLIAFIGSLLVPFYLLSIFYESLFMVLLLPLLLLFIRFEFSNLSMAELIHLPLPLPSDKNDRLSLTDYRRAIVCICFVLCSLFGTGNFASINSFSPAMLKRFISVFSPFTMAALLVLRLLLPIFLCTLSIACVTRLNFHVIRRLTYITHILTDLMAISFFYLLRDSGSWLEIGLSISHYIVCLCMSLSIFFLLSISALLINYSPPPSLLSSAKTDALL